jgi:hypothetical protein
MPETAIPYLFVTAILSLLGFFLLRFYYLVDEIRKDVKEMLINEAKREAIVSNIKEDVDEFKLRQQEYEKKLNFLGRELERLKKANE